VQDRPLRSVRWADIPQLSTRDRRCPAAWQQYWQQSAAGRLRSPTVCFSQAGCIPVPALVLSVGQIQGVCGGCHVDAHPADSAPSAGPARRPSRGGSELRAVRSRSRAVHTLRPQRRFAPRLQFLLASQPLVAALPVQRLHRVRFGRPPLKRWPRTGHSEPRKPAECCIEAHGGEPIRFRGLLVDIGPACPSGRPKAGPARSGSPLQSPRSHARELCR
jgi:hypothetical protein